MKAIHRKSHTVRETRLDQTPDRIISRELMFVSSARQVVHGSAQEEDCVVFEIVAPFPLLWVGEHGDTRHHRVAVRNVVPRRPPLCKGDCVPLHWPTVCLMRAVWFVSVPWGVIGVALLLAVAVAVAVAAARTCAVAGCSCALLIPTASLLTVILLINLLVNLLLLLVLVLLVPVLAFAFIICIAFLSIAFLLVVVSPAHTAHTAHTAHLSVPEDEGDE